MVYHFPKFCRIVLLSALCVIGFGARSQNLKVNFTFDNTTRMVNLVNSLADAFDTLVTEGKELEKVKEIEVSAGMFSQNDWQTLFNNKSHFTGMKKFVITNGVNSVANIPKYANNSIFNVALEHISISNVNQVGNYAFAGLTNLSYIDLPNATNITTTAFMGCTSLVSIDFPNVTQVGKMAFNGCTNLVDVKLPNLKVVNDLAFASCSSLMSIDFPNVTEIGTQAFQGCSNLSDVKLPKVKILPYHAFRSCSSLKSVEFVSVDSLVQHPFYECSSLESIKLPNVTKLAPNSLSGLAALKVLEMDALQILPTEAIYSCNSLESLHLPALEQVNYYGVRNCSGLKSISLPKVKTLYYIPFHASPNIAKLMLGANPPAVHGQNQAFAQLPSNRVIVLVAPDGTPLTGADYDAAKTAYLDVDDGKTTDELWWGWSIAPGGSRFISLGTLQNGTITPSKIEAVPGEEVTLTITPDATYRLKAGSLKVHKTGDETVTVAVTAENKFTMPDYDVTVTAEFEPVPYYNIDATANPSQGGIIYGVYSYPEGATVTLTAVANTGYTFVNWTEGGIAVSADETYTFIASQVRTLVANFEVSTYNITAMAYPTEGGTVTGDGSYKHGETVSLTASPNSGYTFAGWYNGLTFLDNNSPYSFAATEAANIIAKFDTIKVTNITLDITGTLLRKVGDTPVQITATIEPADALDKSIAWNSSNELVATVADGLVQFVGVGYTTITATAASGVSASCIVNVNPAKYSITVDPNITNGEIMNSPSEAAAGDQVDLFVTPESGYQLVAGSLKVNGDASIVEPNGINQYKFSMPGEDVLITAQFEQIAVTPTTYAISIATDIENGTVVANPTMAAEGTPVTLTVTPDPNYQLVAGSLKYNGIDVTETAGTYTFIMPAEPVEITAQFELIPVNPTTYAISIATDIENGTVVANPTMAAEGTPVTLTVTPDPNYQLVAGSLKYNGNDVTETAGTYTFIMPGEDVLITAQFELSTIVVPSVESIALNSTAVTLEVAETHQLQATVLPAEANQGVTWTSNNEAVATVVDGEISTVAVGTAVITATTNDGGLTAYCVVSVNEYTQPDAIATFDDLTLAKADTFWNGTSNPDDLFTSFVSGTYRFVNTTGFGGTYWAGFAYTNSTATDAANWNTTNVGTGIDGSQNYGVAYYSSWDFPTGITVERTNTTDAKPISGMYVTNTAQVVASLTNGDAFAKKFEQGDWFKLTATADNGNSVDFYLADFRSSDATEHYIVDNWEWFDLSPLGDVKTVSFTMSSSDVGAYGVNTPTYFAFDDFGGVAPTFTLTYSAGPNGSLNGELTQTVTYGHSGTAVEALAANSYQFLRWSDGRIDNPRTDTNVQADLSVEAEFIDANISIYTLTYTAAEGGSIRGVATQSVVDGQSGTEVEAVANEGYRFVQWSDGVSTAKRLDENITADLSVQAEFEELAPIVTPTYYAVTLSVSDAAAGAVSGAADYEENTEATVEATANEGYRFVRWSNGETANPYSFTVTGDVALVAEFIKQVRIDYIAASNGSINGAGSQTIDLGSTTTEVEAKPADGYRFVKWSDGHTEASRTDVATTDTTFVASFELIRHILTISVMDADAKPIAFATVTIGNKEYKANDQGQVVDTLVPDRYSYKVECEGYDSKSGEVVLNKNIEEKVVLNKSTNTGLFNNTIESLTVYPNPTVGAVQLEANGMVRVYNASGNLVERVQANGMVLIDLSNYPAGVYIIKVGKASAKVIKN